MKKDSDRLLEYITEIQSIAQAGLFYGKDPFDKERYERLREISAEMLTMKTDLSLNTVQDLFCSDYGYQTPKVDTRAAVFKGGKLLLVHEKNGAWALPGGWCEYNMSPADNAVKEAKEEAGKEVTVRSVIAVQNRDNHNQPRYVYGVVKIFYLCEETGGVFIPNIETTEIGYFRQEDIPLLANEKNNREQIDMCFAAYHSEHWITRFD